MTTAAEHRKTDAARLRAIRTGLAAIQPGQWQRAADDEGEFVEARTEHGELLPIARFHAGATFDEMMFICAAPDMVAFLLNLVDRAIDRARAQKAASPPVQRVGQGAPPDFAAEATMKCDEPAFRTFLAEKHGLEHPLTKDRAVVKLRSILGITSRRELNENGQAAKRWKALRGDFYAWRKAG